MLKRERLLTPGYYQNAHHDEMEDAIHDLLDATEEHYGSVLGCQNRNEQNYIAMMHASLRIAAAVRHLYIAHVGGPDDSPAAEAKYKAEAEEAARRPYVPVPP